ncbi:hypothetical protein QE152_g21809 [Popillia japonica]|uniref:Ribosomal protein S6 n=1 Tax=Popillia japonica TaxID=7064 RepID=A0AAW1KME7_POPJA
MFVKLYNEYILSVITIDKDCSREMNLFLYQIHIVGDDYIVYLWGRNYISSGAIKNHITTCLRMSKNKHSLGLYRLPEGDRMIIVFKYFETSLKDTEFIKRKLPKIKELSLVIVRNDPE